MLSPLLTPDTGLGSTGTALVSSYGGVPVAAGPGVIAGLSPAPIPSGDLWTALEVRGSGFVQGEAVESPQLEVQDTTVHSDSWITAHVRALNGYSGPGQLWLTAPNGAQSNAVSILIAAPPTSGGGLPLTVIGEPVTLPPIITQPVPFVPSVPGTIAPPTTPDVLNVDRQGSAPASSTPPGAPGAAPAPSPELKLSAQPAALAATGSAPSSSGAAPAGGGSSFPWWLLLLAFLFGKAT